MNDDGSSREPCDNASMIVEIDENETLQQYVYLKFDLNVYEHLVRTKYWLDESKKTIDLYVDGAVYKDVRYFAYPLAVDMVCSGNGHKQYSISVYFLDLYRRIHIIFLINLDACAVLDETGCKEHQYSISWKICKHAKCNEVLFRHYVQVFKHFVTMTLHEIRLYGILDYDVEIRKNLRRSALFPTIRLMVFLEGIYVSVYRHFCTIRKMCTCSSDFITNYCICKGVRDYILRWRALLA